MASSADGHRGGKRRHDDNEESELMAKARKLTTEEEMQLKLLASLPSIQQPLRDARGRRPSMFVSSSEIVDAGLSALIGSSATLLSPEDGDAPEVMEEESPSPHAVTPPAASAALPRSASAPSLYRSEHAAAVDDGPSLTNSLDTDSVVSGTFNASARPQGNR